MGGEGGSAHPLRSLLRGPVDLRADDRRFVRLLAEALSRPPAKVPRIHTVRRIVLSPRPTKKTVGITKYSEAESSPDGERARQTVTFFSFLLDQLSEDAALGVIAHELAHAWLNEHVRPETSRSREQEADRTARSWGFGEELDALESETDSV